MPRRKREGQGEAPRMLPGNLSDLDVGLLVGPVLYNHLAKLRERSAENADTSESVPMADILTLVVADYFKVRMRSKDDVTLSREVREPGTLPTYAFVWLDDYRAVIDKALLAFLSDPDVTVEELRALMHCRLETAMRAQEIFANAYAARKIGEDAIDLHDQLTR